MKAVVNTSPLIFLAKLGRLDLLLRPCGTTPAVVAEVAAGLAAGHPEAEAVHRLVEAGHLIVKHADVMSISDVAGLHDGEATVLLLAVDEGIRRVIVDDFAAIRAAKVVGLEPVSTPFLMLEACRDGRLKRGEFKVLLDRLISFGYFLSGPLYARLLEAVERKPLPKRPGTRRKR